MDRKEMIRVIEEMASPAIREELDGFLDIEHDDEEYDLLSAFEDLVDRNESNRWEGCPARYKRQIRQIEIAIGKWVEITPGELARTVTLGGKAWYFQLDGKKYKFNNRYGEE